jgi:hypothetical protein
MSQNIEQPRAKSLWVAGAWPPFKLTDDLSGLGGKPEVMIIFQYVLY